MPYAHHQSWVFTCQHQEILGVSTSCQSKREHYWFMTPSSVQEGDHHSPVILPLFTLRALSRFIWKTTRGFIWHSRSADIVSCAVHCRLSSLDAAQQPQLFGSGWCHILVYHCKYMLQEFDQHQQLLKGQTGQAVICCLRVQKHDRFCRERGGFSLPYLKAFWAMIAVSPTKIRCSALKQSNHP